MVPSLPSLIPNNIILKKLVDYCKILDDINLLRARCCHHIHWDPDHKQQDSFAVHNKLNAQQNPVDLQGFSEKR